MYSMKTQIVNKLGLHARPASNLTMKAKEFASAITIRNLDDGAVGDINAKSVFKLMAGKLKQGTQVEVLAEGEDEQQAVQALVSLLESGFGE